MRPLLCLPALALLLALPSAAPAQADRFEVGQRLRAFERALEKHPGAEGRKRAMAPLKDATSAFFASFVLGKLSEAGRHLDAARHALTSAKKPDADTLWAESLVTRPGTRLLDPADGDLPVKLEVFYKVAAKRPAKAQVRWTLCGPGGKAAAPAVTKEIDTVPVEGKLPLKGIVEGDYHLKTEVLVAGKVLASGEQTVSLASKLGARMKALRKAVEGLKTDDKTSSATAAALLRVLSDLEAKKALETNYPAARLLAEAEALVAAVKAGKRYYGKDRPGQFWLALAAKGGPSPVRVQVPEAAKKGKLLPLVVALHGAGGSENMFFDGYGDGKVAKLCAERGWLLLAPRGRLAEGAVGELAKIYPVDTKRVFLVGHSMGASNALLAATAAPEKYAAVAALGGGGRVRASDGLKKLPFFVGVGEQDFALGTARSLHFNLVKAGVKRTAFKKYSDVEHLIVVQLALKDVFAFFDEAAKR